MGDINDDYLRSLFIKMRPQKDYNKAIKEGDVRFMYTIAQEDGWNNCLDHLIDYLRENSQPTSIEHPE